ncbi:MAG: cupin domain-containing protein [Bryobacterales bacterium]|nr:cupin domain-containing protein [Bryobacterales bacterium]
MIVFNLQFLCQSVLLSLITIHFWIPLASAQAPAIADSKPGIRVVRFADSLPFKMGTVTSRRIISPAQGAKNTTLNLSVSEPGAEFAQHTHGDSTDTILVLEGEVNLRQGPGLHLFKAGEAAFVPAGQIHGTITAGTGPAVMISFQNPPDLVLYTGARDSSKPNAAPVQGDITPGAVKYVNFREKNGQFVGLKEGATVVAAFHRKLTRNDRISTRVEPNGEALFFVWRGAIRVSDGKNVYKAGERDTVFISGKARLTVTGDADGVTEVVQVQAPPLAGK